MADIARTGRIGKVDPLDLGLLPRVAIAFEDQVSVCIDAQQFADPGRFIVEPIGKLFGFAGGRIDRDPSGPNAQTFLFLDSAILHQRTLHRADDGLAIGTHRNSFEATIAVSTLLEGRREFLAECKPWWQREALDQVSFVGELI